MASVTLHSSSGAAAGTVELSDQVFGVQPNVPVMHQVVVAQLAHRRAGTQSTKTRSEVRGGGIKPYKQKGTGRARQGSTRAPHFSGGAVALGPKPRSYAQRTPKKMIKLALRSALSDRAADGKVFVVDSWNFDTPKTKDAKNALATMGLEGVRTLIVINGHDFTTLLSFRNLPEVQLIDVAELNTYDVLCNDVIVFSSETLPTFIGVPSKRDRIELKASLPYGPGSALPLADGSAPEGFSIKGNADSGLYHTEVSPWYGRTKAEFWFATEAAAQAAGFVDATDKAAREALKSDEAGE
jgi:large subunit ribosomal protein L4